MGAVPKPDIINQLLPGHAGRGRGNNNPKIIVIHTQAGEGNPFEWFKSLGTSGAGAADCTIWNPSAAKAKLVRYLYDSDTAWTNGSWTEPINHTNSVLEDLFKRRVYSGDVSLTVENEGNQSFTDAQYARLAQLIAWWSDQYGIPIDRNHIVGHSEIGPHKQCPGPFDFNKVISLANQVYQGAYGMPTQPLQPRAKPFEVNFTGTIERITVTDPFLSVWEKYGGIPLLGLPMTPERNANDYPGLGFQGSYQIFERCRLEWHDDTQSVMLGRLGAEWLNMVGRK